jgi:hypothetical protein
MTSATGAVSRPATDAPQDPAAVVRAAIDTQAENGDLDAEAARELLKRFGPTPATETRGPARRRRLPTPGLCTQAVAASPTDPSRAAQLQPARSHRR